MLHTLLLTTLSLSISFLSAFKAGCTAHSHAYIWKIYTREVVVQYLNASFVIVIVAIVVVLVIVVVVVVIVMLVYEVKCMSALMRFQHSTGPTAKPTRSVFRKLKKCSFGMS